MTVHTLFIMFLQCFHATGAYKMCKCDRNFCFYGASKQESLTVAHPDEVKMKKDGCFDLRHAQKAYAQIKCMIYKENHCHNQQLTCKVESSAVRSSELNPAAVQMDSKQVVKPSKPLSCVGG